MHFNDMRKEEIRSFIFDVNIVDYAYIPEDASSRTNFNDYLVNDSSYWEVLNINEFKKILIKQKYKLNVFKDESKVNSINEFLRKLKNRVMIVSKERKSKSCTLKFDITTSKALFEEFNKIISTEEIYQVDFECYQSIMEIYMTKYFDTIPVNLYSIYKIIKSLPDRIFKDILARIVSKENSIFCYCFLRFLEEYDIKIKNNPICHYFKKKLSGFNLKDYIKKIDDDTVYIFKNVKEINKSELMLMDILRNIVSSACFYLL